MEVIRRQRSVFNASLQIAKGSVWVWIPLLFLVLSESGCTPPPAPLEDIVAIGVYDHPRSPFEQNLHATLTSISRGSINIHYTGKFVPVAGILASATAAIDQGCKVLVADATEHEVEFRKFAAQHEGVQFIFISTEPTQPPNVAVLRLEAFDPVKPFGSVSASLSKTRRVGIVTNRADPLTGSADTAFTDGVSRIPHTVTVLRAVLPAGIDPSTSKAELSLASQGADFIYNHLTGKLLAATFLKQGRTPASLEIKLTEVASAHWNLESCLLDEIFQYSRKQTPSSQYLDDEGVQPPDPKLQISREWVPQVTRALKGIGER